MRSSNHLSEVLRQLTKTGITAELNLFENVPEARQSSLRAPAMYMAERLADIYLDSQNTINTVLVNGLGMVFRERLQSALASWFCTTGAIVPDSSIDGRYDLPWIAGG